MRRLMFALGIGLSGLLFAEPAIAQVPESLHVSVAPATLRWPDSKAVHYEVRMTTGATPAAFGVTWLFDRTPYIPEAAGDGIVPHLAANPRFVGPGSVRWIDAVMPAVLYLSPCRRTGVPLDAPTYAAWIEMPAMSTSRLVVRAELTAAPWLGQSFSARFAYFLDNNNPTQISPLGTPSVTLEQPPYGVRVTVRRSLRGHHDRRFTPTLTGKTDPPIPGSTVVARAIRTPREVSLGTWRSRGSIKLGRVRVDPSGHFRIRSRGPLAPGMYRTIVRATSTPANVVPDFACGPRFRIPVSGSQLPHRR